MGKIREFGTDSFVNSPTNTIATDSGLEDFFGNYYTEALITPRIRMINQRQKWCPNVLPFL